MEQAPEQNYQNIICVRFALQYGRIISNLLPTGLPKVALLTVYSSMANLHSMVFTQELVLVS